LYGRSFVNVIDLSLSLTEEINLLCCHYLITEDLSFLIGCSTTSNHNSADLIKGEWVWIESSGGIAGSTETPESIQKEITIKISDNTIKQFVNGTLESDRTYTIENRESAIFGDVKEMII